MRLPAFSVILIFLAAAVAGYGLLPRLSVRWLPTVERADLQLSWQWPGAAPQTLEARVTAPLEGALALLPGVQAIKSISEEGQGRINLSLDPEFDLDWVRFNAAARVRQVYPQLPLGVSYPTLQLYSSEDTDDRRPLLTYALSGPDNAAVLYRHARESLAPRLGLTSGLDRVEVSGGNEYTWQIRYNEGLLQELQLPVARLQQQLQDWFRPESLGPLSEDGQQRFATLTSPAGDSLTADDWKGIPLLARSGRLITLGEVADISYQIQPPRSLYRIDGKNSIRLLLYSEPAANELELAAALQEAVQRLSLSLLPGYRLTLEEDTTDYLRAELQKIQWRTAASLGILLLFVLIVYRSGRHLAVVGRSFFLNSASPRRARAASRSSCNERSSMATSRASLL